MRLYGRFLSVGLFLVAGLLLFSDASHAGYPDKPVEFIAPANPGGGWDLTCRLSAQVLKEAGLEDIRQEPAQFKLREPRDMRIVGIKPRNLLADPS